MKIYKQNSLFYITRNDFILFIDFKNYKYHQKYSEESRVKALFVPRHIIAEIALYDGWIDPESWNLIIL